MLLSLSSGLFYLFFFNIYSLAEAMVQIQSLGSQQGFTRLLTRADPGLTLVLQRDPWCSPVNWISASLSLHLGTKWWGIYAFPLAHIPGAESSFGWCTFWREPQETQALCWLGTCKPNVHSVTPDLAYLLKTILVGDLCHSSLYLAAFSREKEKKKKRSLERTRQTLMFICKVHISVLPWYQLLVVPLPGKH